MSREIWFVTPEFNPAGGDSCRIVELAHEVKGRLDLIPVIVTTRSSDEPPDEIAEGIKVLRVSRKTGRPWDELLFSLAVCRRLRRSYSSVAVLHVNSPDATSFFVLRAARRLGVRTVIQLTLMGSDDPQTLSLHRKYTRSLSRRLVHRLGEADAILALSRALAHRAVEFGWPPEKVRCSGIAKDPLFFHPAADWREKEMLRHGFGVPSNAILVSYVGYLSRRKGTDILIQAWRRIALEYPSAVLILAGDFSRGGDISREMFEGLGSSNVRLLGPLGRRRVADLLRASDLFVFPTLREGFGAALLEAVMSGLPAVASHLGGITDMMVQSGENGILSPPGDAQSLALAIGTLVHSARMREQMGAKSREIARSFYPGAIWPAYQWAYTGGRNAHSLRHAELP